MYGGTTVQDFYLDTVWALSIPSFDWVQLSGDSSDPSRLPGARRDPICATVGNRYMLSWGGRALQDNNINIACDVHGNNVFLLDISTGKWVDQYNPVSEYLVPDAVFKLPYPMFLYPIFLYPIFPDLAQIRGRQLRMGRISTCKINITGEPMMRCGGK
jgi:hypothetical protein